MASAADRAEVIDSSRQIGVRTRRASSACPTHVVLRQRLLDQQQVERVELRRAAGRRRACRRCWRRPAGGSPEPLAHGLDRLDVPARLDLELDPAVALGRGSRPPTSRAPNRVFVDSDRDAAVDLGAHRSEMVAERDAGVSQLGVEDGHLERRLGHRMTVDRAEELRDPIGGDVAGLEKPWQQVTTNHVLGSVDVLGRVERPRHRHALAPTFDLAGDNPHEEDVALVSRRRTTP